MAFINLKNNVVLVKNGGTPTSTDNITISRPVSINPAIANGEIEQVSNTLGSLRTYVDGYQKTREFDIEMIARTNDTDTSPRCVELFKSCLISSETIDPGVSVDYSVDSVSTPSSSTIHAYEDGEKYSLTGAVANFNVNGTIGEPLKFVFNFSRFVDTITNEANPSVVQDNNKLFFIDKITGITENGSQVNRTEFSFNMGNDIQSIYRTDLTEYSITDYKPELSLTMLKIKNDLTVWDDLNNQDLKSIVITAKTQETTPKTLVITIPTAVLSNVEGGDLSGKKILTKTYSCQNTNGDDNFSISYQEA